MAEVLSRLADFLPYRLSITSNAVSQRIAVEYRARFGLKVPEWRVMAILGESGALTQRQLVSATFMDKVAVNRACKVLADKGWVQRTPNLHDGRSHLIELNDEGRDIYRQVIPLALKLEEQILDCLTVAEQKALRRTLDKLFAQVMATDSGMDADDGDDED
ncbi:MarR family winged helix-turn-helix transcriptional regulator [Croceicoccus mobilis]|uniref:MarR family transcriptional regulator n=1 Tax=Croceicoccus mobilis TaxID=1703339 RepID=A0A917DPF3_9SPHN|nr:MarR family transcriptional regulator [Croceicoccus mobilis]GGD56491.1 MarR family transcriptional regulator [Croceicoccus mobilis]